VRAFTVASRKWAVSILVHKVESYKVHKVKKSKQKKVQSSKEVQN
jgi:hypothetical protein